MRRSPRLDPHEFRGEVLAEDDVRSEDKAVCEVVSRLDHAARFVPKRLRIAERVAFQIQSDRVEVQLEPVGRYVAGAL
jgi:hypothetical protein